MRATAEDISGGWSLCETVLVREGGGFGAVAYLELGEDARDVVFYGLLADEQLTADLFVGLSLSE